MYFLVKSGTGYLMKIDDNPHLASNDEDPKVMHFYNVDDAVHAVLQLHFLGYSAVIVPVLDEV